MSNVIISGGDLARIQKVLHAASASCNGTGVQAYQEAAGNAPFIEALSDRAAAVHLSNDVYVAQVDRYINNRVAGSFANAEIVQLRAMGVYRQYRPSPSSIPASELIALITILTRNNEANVINILAGYVAQAVWSEMSSNPNKARGVPVQTNKYRGVRAVHETFGRLVNENIERYKNAARAQSAAA